MGKGIISPMYDVNVSMYVFVSELFSLCAFISFFFFFFLLGPSRTFTGVIKVALVFGFQIAPTLRNTKWIEHVKTERLMPLICKREICADVYVKCSDLEGREKHSCLLMPPKYTHCIYQF